MSEQDENIKSYDVENFAAYIQAKKQEFGWSNEKCAKECNLSKGEISKLINKERKSVSAQTFYYVYKGFKDTLNKAVKAVFLHRDFSLKPYIQKKRNEFGTFMLQFEESKNSTEEIAIKTDIDENRIKEIYFRKGSPEAYEFLMIEKAANKKPGELFEKFYGAKD